LQFFRLVGDTPPDAPKVPISTPSLSESRQPEYPPEVEQAFNDYIGNRPAVRRLKIECTYARKSKPVQMPINLMLCGLGGLGKTELARRIDRRLNLPLVDVPANTIKSVDTLLQRIQATLHNHALEASEAGTDSGLPKRRYPRLVVFLDEIHLLKNPDQYLNLFEPKERRAVGAREVDDLLAATFIGATTDKGILPAPFRSRFTCVDLEPYSAEDVAQIIAPSLPTVDIAFLVALANMSRRNPRIALTKAGEVQRRNGVHPEAYPLTMAGWRSIAVEQWMVDELGLTNADRDSSVQARVA
jgi:holliday junction DNA helicase RuvB